MTTNLTQSDKKTVQEIVSLLQDGANVNISNEKGFSLLMRCAKNHDIESIHILLSYNVNINARDINNLSALDYAIEYDHLKVIKLLVKNGAHIHDNSYMYALREKKKIIVSYFDSLDKNKQIFLKPQREIDDED